MTDVPLDALLRRASRLAGRLFDKDGGFDPFYVCDIPGSELMTVTTPLISAPGLAAIEYKDRLTAKLREEFAEKGVARYVFVSEGWITEYPKGMTPLEASQHYAALDFTLKSAPERREYPPTRHRVRQRGSDTGREIQCATHRDARASRHGRRNVR
jgi:hypothetical protein